MPLTQLEHYLVLTDDLERTRDFYAQALGMRSGPRPPLDFPGFWMYLGEIPCIHLAEWGTYTSCMTKAGFTVSTRASGTGSVDHIAFNASDVGNMRATLDRCGVPYVQNEVPSIGLTQLFLYDPNGLKVEINFR